MDNELIELLEFAKSQKIDFIEYNGKRYNVNDYKYKQYYTIYNKYDFYVSECDSLDKLQGFLHTQKKRCISVMIANHQLIKDKYYIYPMYEMAL